MLRIYGVVSRTYEGKAESTGREFSTVDVEGMRCFIDPGANKPEVGVEIVANVQASYNADTKQTSFRMLSWQAFASDPLFHGAVSSGNGGGTGSP